MGEDGVCACSQPHGRAENAGVCLVVLMRMGRRGLKMRFREELRANLEEELNMAKHEVEKQSME